ncbi:hypothetical protein, partial [uncultured Paenibacillus sp.]|uniref:hypothetical protein n=1 Tax=uncultured Paenibacillus sp. TaxID=227322 RepID=UPI0028D1D54F
FDALYSTFQEVTFRIHVKPSCAALVGNHATIPPLLAERVGLCWKASNELAAFFLQRSCSLIFAVENPT